MRRKEREVTDRERINEIIEKCKVCRIGFNDNGKVYIVPLNFGFEEKDGKRIFYFHGAKEGRKIELIKSAPYVGFEMDTDCQIIEGNTASNYSASYQSIIGNGRVSFVQSNEDKIHALSLLMYAATGKKDWNFPAEALCRVCVFRLEIEEISCKEHIRK